MGIDRWRYLQLRSRQARRCIIRGLYSGEIMNWLKQLFLRRRLDAELHQEITFHLEKRIEELVAGGMPVKQALGAACREFGNVTLIEERCREAWHWPTLESFWADITLTAHQLRKSPVFTLAAVATLALGIGANTAIFSVINSVLLRPLSYPEPNRIVQFLLALPEGPRPSASISDFRLWQQQTQAFEQVSAYDFSSNGVTLAGEPPQQFQAIHVTPEYFRLFGAPMLLGRTFYAEEASPGGRKVVVLSYGLWKSRFGGNRDIVGKSISLDDDSYTVLGVTGASFHCDPAADLWIPFQFALSSDDTAHYFQVAGRLKPGISLEKANAKLKLAAAEALRTYSLSNSNLEFIVKPLRDMIVGDVRSSLLVMSVAVALVLLIACANVANLLLVRATGRTREFAIRFALGAGRIRIVRQLLTESIVLSLIGGVLGVVLGLVGVRALLLLNPGNLPRIGESGALIDIDWRMLAFTVGLSLVTGILFGLFPALSASRSDVNCALKESGNQQGAGARHYRLRSCLVVAEMALSVVLLIGAGLLIRTFVALREVQPGFDFRNVLTLDLSLPQSRFAKTDDVSRLVNSARTRIAAIPGANDSAMTCCPPFASRFGLPFTVLGRSVEDSSTTDALWTYVSPGYFDVFKIPVLSGRSFTLQDDEAAPPVVLINEAMAKEFWPNQNPLGQQIVIGNGLGSIFKDVPRQIIGIVANTRDVDLSTPPAPAMIIPQPQVSNAMTAFWSQFGPAYWLVRTRITPHQIAPLISKQLTEASGGLAVGHIRPMDEVMGSSISRQNFNMLLLTIFGVSALILATVGIYGVVSYSVAQRSREIGIRMALGAGRNDIRNLVLRHGMLLAIVGVSIGVSAAFGLARFIASLLFGVTKWDPEVFLSVPLLLLGAALLAVWLPARRTMRNDPIVALRYE
jgi:putative ABC transport system permease protein